LLLKLLPNEKEIDHMQPVENASEYPRPPLIELVSGSVEISILGEVIAQDQRYVRVCETFHPPTIYLHPSAFKPGTIHPSTGRPSFCEWKGVASYWDVSAVDGTSRRVRAGWSYPDPTQSFALLAGWISIYPRSVDGCRLEGETVLAQPGVFYGGWITSWTRGPFKGDPNHPELI
jgi:uncharacterized protein (DUF427 family)